MAWMERYKVPTRYLWVVKWHADRELPYDAHCPGHHPGMRLVCGLCVAADLESVRSGRCINNFRSDLVRKHFEPREVDTGGEIVVQIGGQDHDKAQKNGLTAQDAVNAVKKLQLYGYRVYYLPADVKALLQAQGAAVGAEGGETSDADGAEDADDANVRDGEQRGDGGDDGGGGGDDTSDDALSPSDEADMRRRREET
jgi:hypothetical protein